VGGPDRLPPPGTLRVLMVCMGNICRSPTAEAVLRRKLEEAELQGWVTVDSAGTHAYHVGNPPDERAQAHAARRGYDLAPLRARQVAEADFMQHDLLLAMDWDNLALLEAECPDDPAVLRKLRRLAEFIPADASHAGVEAVPDPYYGGVQGFEHVLDVVEQACDGLVLHLRARLSQAQGLTPQ